MTENSSSPKVSVIIPAYHEETKITTGLHDLFETLDFLQLDHEVIVIVDGDPKTEAAVSKYKNPHLKILSYTKNRGKGYALCHGVKAATGEVVIFWDAGTQISQESLKLAWRIFSFSDADIVIGSKRHLLSKVNYPLKRRIYSVICQIAALIAFNLKVKDTQVGLKIYKKEILNKIIPKMKTQGYAIDIEMLIAAGACGYKRIFETPVDLSAYQFGGAVNYKAVFQVARDMLRTYFRLLRGYYG